MRSTPDIPPAPAIADMLCHEVYAANLAFGRVYAPLLAPLGVTYPQFLALAALWREDDRSVGDIGAEIGLETSTLTPLIKRLEKAGLVARARDRKDERRVRVRLTPQGEALRAQAGCIPPQIAAAAGLDPAEMSQLRALLGKLRSALATAEDAAQNP